MQYKNTETKKVEVHNIAFDGLIPAILTGEIDMVAAAMVATPERAEKIAFVPYFKAGLGILLNPNVQDVYSKDDLKGKKVAVQLGTTGAFEAHTIDHAVVREFDHNSEALLELKNGGVDAVICSIPVAKHYITTDAGKHMHLVQQPLQQQILGLGFSPANAELKNMVEQALLELKKDGSYDNLYKKWFGTEPPEVWR